MKESLPCEFATSDGDSALVLLITCVHTNVWIIQIKQGDETKLLIFIHPKLPQQWQSNQNQSTQNREIPQLDTSG